ncbi:hypothetical protein CCACVL1_29928 [Corchorus capsularis]|uniref:Uncharacterized protein n=1 Tax=Corchorus capsularis TaxID=210143 RepID=A0A1R3FZG7_COCAP|nr:hypothetical protein CCACVL1_29928 [Corchorus capsularis]
MATGETGRAIDAGTNLVFV